MSLLPPNATGESRVRCELARELARGWPVELGGEIALTGSASRGVADALSDIELNFWVDRMPSRAKCSSWLEALGASDVVLDREVIADGSAWSDFRFRGVPVEAGWQPIAVLEDLLRAILAAEVTDHDRLVVASMVEHAVPLRTGGLLAWWQAELAQYPDELQERLVTQAMADWTTWSFPQDRLVLGVRGDHVALAQQLVRDVQRVIRILFALNRRWEPEWKWLASNCHSLPMAPQRFMDRIGAIFSLPQPSCRVVLCLDLIRDTLRLMPPSSDVDQVSAVIRRCLGGCSEPGP